MATKKEIKVLLDKLGLTEMEFGDLWIRTAETNWIVNKLDEELGGDWRKTSINILEQIDGQIERDAKSNEEKMKKEEMENEEKKKAEELKQYYIDNWEDIVYTKLVEDPSTLTEDEIRELVFSFDVDEIHIATNRWHEIIETIIEIKGKNFSISWERGLTEFQEDEFGYCAIKEVKKVTKTIVVDTWE